MVDGNVFGNVALFLGANHGRSKLLSYFNIISLFFTQGNSAAQSPVFNHADKNGWNIAQKLSHFACILTYTDQPQH